MELLSSSLLLSFGVLSTALSDSQFVAFSVALSDALTDALTRVLAARTVSRIIFI